MKHLPLRHKLLGMISSLFLVTVAVMSFSLWNKMQASTQVLTEDVDKSLAGEIRGRLSASAGLYGERIASFITNAAQTAETTAAIVADADVSQAVNREALQHLLGAMLTQDKDLSALYAQFEANGYDGRDSDFIADVTGHSVKGVGTLEVYFLRGDNGQVSLQQVEDANEKYNTSINEHGTREAEWYLCPKEGLKPCLLEPYLYEISPGNNALMTSVTLPVVRDNVFKGVVGVDINLPVFKKLIDELSSSLYGGQAKVTLLSEQGLIVASSHDTAQGRPLKEVVGAELAKDMLALAKGQDYLQTDSSLVVAYPINIALTGSQWLLIIDVPNELAFAAATQVRSRMDQMAADMGRFMLILGLVVGVIAVLLTAVFIRSVVAPINQIQTRVQQLASAEGDLTQQLNVDEHAELIDLGNGFNAFITKLHGLISELKAAARASRRESETTAGIAEETKQSVARQYSDIESVVTAVNEMSHTAHEIAKASEHTAAESTAMATQVQAGQASLTDAVKLVSTMASESRQAKAAVAKVADSSINISKILDVISAIAAQTNLLALNAAIEAARAGEQGRGFAVVADEVRSLASKTQASTNDIGQLITALQLEVRSASDIIDKGAELAGQATARTELAFEALSSMVARINEISNQVTQIATAAEEQSCVTEEVSRNITGISDSAAELMTLAGKARASSENLSELVSRQDEQLCKLRT